METSVCIRCGTTLTESGYCSKCEKYISRKNAVSVTKCRICKIDLKPKGNGKYWCSLCGTEY